MPIRRGDVVVVAAADDFGKPRPAVIVQTDAFPENHASLVICQMTSELAENHASLVICQMTSELADVPDFRVTIEPSAENGLRITSQIMADKPTTVRRQRIRQQIGRLSAAEIARLNTALAFVMGLAD
jgi:mRNA interferase MazF